MLKTVNLNIVFGVLNILSDELDNTLKSSKKSKLYINPLIGVPSGPKKDKINKIKEENNNGALILEKKARFTGFIIRTIQ
tara:strand:+ start:142 stop:381 length:240 start_codon:yes stop_codon:yes gene_type:complete